MEDTEHELTALGRSEVLAGGRSTGLATASLLDAQGAALDDLALQALFGSISLLSRDHVDKAEATRLLGVGIDHDRAVLDIAVLFEQTRDVGLRQTRVNTSDKQVGASVDGTLILIFHRLAWRSSGKPVSCVQSSRNRWNTCRRSGHWGSGCERGRLEVHREERRCGRGRTGARLYAEQNHLVRWDTNRRHENTHRRSGRCRCRNQP